MTSGDTSPFVEVRFLYETPEFCKIKTMEDHLNACLEETALSNLKTSNYLFGNDCYLLNTEILLEVCYATLFTLHNHVSDTTFAKKDDRKDDIAHYFGEICKKLDLDERIRNSFVSKYNRFQTRRWQELEQAFLFLSFLKTAVEINVSNKPIKGTHFGCLPDGYKCCLLTKDKTGTSGNIRLIPYYDFINNGAKLDGHNTDRNDDLIGGYAMPNEHLYLEQDDREHRVKVRELTEEDDWLLVELAEKYGNDFKEGTDLREKQLQWRKEHGRPNI